tara:strand:+ start:368 stop:604 length:237 start_codon:yes stop_codon:yes gene_type:complete
MIEFLTALVITYNVAGEPWETKVVYATEDHCHQAMNEGIIDPLYKQLFDLYGNDIIIRCHVTDYITQTPTRPRMRPNG